MSGPHSWSEPVRFEHKSERVCARCGLIKVSHHEGNEHWIDFWRPAGEGPPQLIASDRTPACRDQPTQSGEVPFSG